MLTQPAATHRVHTLTSAGSTAERTESQRAARSPARGHRRELRKWRCIKSEHARSEGCWLRGPQRTGSFVGALGRTEEGARTIKTRRGDRVAPAAAEGGGEARPTWQGPGPGPGATQSPNTRRPPQSQHKTRARHARPLPTHASVSLAASVRPDHTQDQKG